MIDILSWIFLLLGAFFSVVAGIGVLRLPDVYTRIHAVGLKDTLGVAFTFTGLMLQAGFTLVSAKLVLIWLFLWFTSPVSAHAMVKAARASGIYPLLGSPPREMSPNTPDGTRPGGTAEKDGV